MKPTIEALDQYPIELRKISPEDGEGYIATIPMLGRFLFEGTGSTREEAVADLMSFAEEMLKEYRHRGLELPEPPRDDMEYSGRLLLRLPKYLHRRVSEEANENGVSLNTYLISILADSFRTPYTTRIIQKIQGCLVKLEQKLPVVVNYVEADAIRRFYDGLIEQEEVAA